MDIMGADFYRVVQMMRSAQVQRRADSALPISAGDTFKGHH